MLAAKRNQRRLYEDLRDLLEQVDATGFEVVPHDCATPLDKGHGRLAKGKCWTISDLDRVAYLSTGKEWSGLRWVVTVVGRREGVPESQCDPEISSAALMSRQNRFWQRCEFTGASGIRCTGAWKLLSRGRLLGVHGLQFPEPGNPAEHLPLHVEAGNQAESWHPGQMPASRLERRSPLEGSPQLKRDCPGCLLTSQADPSRRCYNAPAVLPSAHPRRGCSRPYC